MAIVESRRGVAVASNPLASAAAIEVLAAGGSVVDAAIAGAATLCVVLPQKCSLGGDGFALVHEGGATAALNASGAAPALATLDRFADGIPDRGPLSSTVPAIVAGWGDLHARYGRLRWSKLFERAIAHAQNVPVSRELAADITLLGDVIARNAACEAQFGRLRRDDPLRQPALAKTLEGIATHGARWFYDGPPARQIAAASHALGGLLRAEDFARVETAFVAPLAARYNGLEVLVPPPNSFGALLLLQLAMLRDAPREEDSVDRLARWIDVNRRAFEIAAARIADPEHVAPIDIEALAREGGGGARGSGDLGAGTVTLSVADHTGAGIVMMLSVFRGFGSGVLDAASGVVLNNRLRAFALDARLPNCLAPGKRPAHTLSPALVLRDGALRYLAASPGGVGQTVTLTQVLSHLVDRNLSLDEALALPRWSREAEGDPIIETSFGASMIEQLGSRGIKAKTGAARAVYFGSAEVIERTADGRLRAAADPRREGCAIAL